MKYPGAGVERKHATVNIRRTDAIQMRKPFFIHVSARWGSHGIPYEPNVLTEELHAQGIPAATDRVNLFLKLTGHLAGASAPSELLFFDMVFDYLVGNQRDRDGEQQKNGKVAGNFLVLHRLRRLIARRRCAAIRPGNRVVSTRG